MLKRGDLPLKALEAFEVVSRHRSFTRAAEELLITPAAVGLRIRALEKALGISLFNRTPHGLELTRSAMLGLPSLRQGLEKFEQCVTAMQAHRAPDLLTIAAPPDLTARWLAPRLARYAEANAHVRLRVISLCTDFDIEESNLDLAIIRAIGKGDLPGSKLGKGELVTIGEGPRIAWPGDPQADGAHLTVADAGLALNAALTGLGQARVPDLIAGDHSGVRAGCSENYWLISRASQWRLGKVQALAALLSEEFKPDASLKPLTGMAPVAPDISRLEDVERIDMIAA